MTPEDAIFELIEAAAAGIPVIFANENGTQPTPPYIAMAVRWAQASRAEQGEVDEHGNALISQHNDATVELQGFGAGAYDGLDALQLHLQHPELEERAEVLGLAVFDRGRLQSIPVLREGARYEQRALLELGVRYVVASLAAVPVIESVAPAT
nr:MAG TPA: glycosyltransferase [Caudoviricetes sp.]